MPNSQQVLARHKTRIRFRNPDMDFFFSYMLGIADLLGGHGPLFAVANRVRGSRASDWRDEFWSLADHAQSRAAEAGAARRPEEARQWALTACYANRAGLQFARPDAVEFAQRWQKMEDAFSEAMRWWQAPVTAIEVPFEAGSLPGYLVKHDDEPRPAILMVGGGDTSREDLFAFAGLAAWQHGYNAIMVDLPGQGKAPARGLTFLVDMHRPITAVLDRLYQEIPATTHVAAYGVSGGGFFSAQAVASDPRIDAWIAATPIYDVSEVFRKEFGAALRVPGRLQHLMFAVAGRVDEATRINLVRYAWQFGVEDFSAGVSEVFRRARPVDLTKISCPALFLYSAGEGPELERQLTQTAAHLTGRGVPVTMRRFEVADGADAHCQLNNLRLAQAIIFDWLGELYGA